MFVQSVNGFVEINETGDTRKTWGPSSLTCLPENLESSVG